MSMSPYRSIFSPATARERRDNFEDYWIYSQEHAGAILESEKNLTRKKDALLRFQGLSIRVRKPLADPERFYRNYVRLVDDPRSLDRKTLLLTFLYKFARHEWAGISAVWDGIPSMARSRSTTERISRYHLCEEFCHIRLFHEMFRTFQLDRIEWIPLGKWMGRVYRYLPKFPEAIMSPPAFVSELMGLTLYRHLDRLLGRHPRRRAGGARSHTRHVARDHDRRTRPHGAAPQFHRPDRHGRLAAHGRADVPDVLSGPPRVQVSPRHRQDDRGGQGVRLQHDGAGRYRVELDSLLLQTRNGHGLARRVHL